MESAQNGPMSAGDAPNLSSADVVGKETAEDSAQLDVVHFVGIEAALELALSSVAPGGRVAVDLEITGEIQHTTSLWQRIGPVQAARRLRSARRIGARRSEDPTRGGDGLRPLPHRELWPTRSHWRNEAPHHLDFHRP